MQRGKVTISDVARRAKVSVGTVSHVLTGNTPVTAERRQRVELAIEQLGYVPNVHAQGLRQTRSSLIGVCFPYTTTSYLNDLSEALERIATEAGYSIMHVFSRHDPEIEFRRIRELMRYRVAGLILFPSSAPEPSLDFAHAKGLPLVLVDRPSDDLRFDAVMLDNRKVMREAVRRLIGLGHRRLLFVCRSSELLVTQHRIEGLQAALRAAPATVRVGMLEIRDDEAAFARNLAAVLQGAAAPTAIVASNSHQASLVLGRLHELGVSVPEAVSMLTFDDPEWARLVQPELSVIRQPTATLAQSAWDLLMRRIAHGAKAPESIALDAAIEFRASVAAPPAERRDGRRPTAGNSAGTRAR